MIHLSSLCLIRTKRKVLVEATGVEPAYGNVKCPLVTEPAPTYSKYSNDLEDTTLEYLSTVERRFILYSGVENKKLADVASILLPVRYIVTSGT